MITKPAGPKLFRRRRRLSRRLTIGLTFLASLLPVAGLLTVSYLQTLAHVDAQLSFLSNTTEARTNAIFSSTRSDLRTLAGQMANRPVADSVPLMEHATFNSLYVDEYGYIVTFPPVRRQGKLVYGDLIANNLRVFQPPIPMIRPKLLAVAGTPGEIAIVPPASVTQGGERIICNYSMEKDAAGHGLIVDALINPAILTEFQDYTNIGDQSGVFLVFDSGARIRSTGRMPASLLPPINAETPALTHYRGRRMAIARSSRYPFVVVAAASDPSLLREWRRNALVFGPLGLLLSLALVCWIARQAQGSLDAELEAALNRGELTVFYQPLVHLPGGRCAGAEALLRWRHLERGLVLPGVFIPLAEETGLIVPMTQWLMARVAADLGPLLARRPDLHLAINLSAMHFLEGDAAADASRLLSGHIAARQVTFELTESRRLSDENAQVERVRCMMQAMQSAGYRLALDDFGTGYSNLAYLKHFLLDVLKIDRAFVSGIETEDRAAGLVDQVIAIAEALGLQVVGEGVEREAQAAYLAGRGVALAQGYLYARPMPAADFLAYVEAEETDQKERKS